MSKRDRELEDWVGEKLLQARELPGAGRGELEAERGLGETWAIGPVGRSRDSKLLEAHNFEVVAGDLQEHFPDDVEVLRFGHWALGWVEELAWRAVDGRGRLTEVAEAAYRWHEKLEGYPIADEDSYSEKEHELAYDNVVSAAEDYYRREDEDGPAKKFFARYEKEPEAVVEQLYQMLVDEGVRGIESPEEYSISRDELEGAMRRIGWLR